jgi:hypothetical protein
MARALGIAAVLATLVAATGHSTSAGSYERVVVTRDSIGLPAGCTLRGLADLADRFVDAFNRAEWKRIDALVAPSGPRENDFTFFDWESRLTRDQVVPFLEALHARGQRLRLLIVHIAAPRRDARASSVGIYLVHERNEGARLGKWVIDCATQRIFQAAMYRAPSQPRLLQMCPRPKGWSTSGPIVACTGGPNARATSPSFDVTATQLTLPRRCAPNGVRRRMTIALEAFNRDDGGAFAKQFVRRGQFHPYTVSIRAELIGRARIARFVRARYAAGDGWTATHLRPPQGTAGLPSRTVYALEFDVSHQGSPFADGAGSKLVVNCSSGLLERWVGPASKLPPAA